MWVYTYRAEYSALTCPPCCDSECRSNKCSSALSIKLKEHSTYADGGKTTNSVAAFS